MWRRDVRTDWAGSHRLECRDASLRRVLGALAVRETHGVNLAVATGWRGGPVGDRRSHVLASAASGALVKASSQQAIRLPNSRGHTRPIAHPCSHLGIDIISKSCITRREGPCAGVGLTGSYGSQS